MGSVISLAGWEERNLIISLFYFSLTIFLHPSSYYSFSFHPS